MKKSKEFTALTELEGAALAVIARQGPCTSYVVKEAFRASPSDFWSGSAGAIYPLVKRLLQRGYLDSLSAPDDKRAKKLLSITTKGYATMRLWLEDSKRAARFGFDPLRTRLLFIDLLPSDRQKTFLEETRRELQMETAPPESNAPHVQILHEVWTQSRREAFEAVASHIETMRREKTDT